MRSIRVLFIDYIRTEIGGGHFVLARLAGFFRADPAAGVEPYISLNSFGGFTERFIDPGIPVREYRIPEAVLGIDRRASLASTLPRLFSLLRFAAGFAHDLASRCRRERIDIVHANSMTTFLLCAIPAGLSGARTAFHLHDALLSPSEGGNIGGFARKALIFFMRHFADGVIANSHFVRETVVSREPRLAGRVFAIHNGIDPASARFREGGRPPGPIRLLSMGRMDWRKGFQCGIEAVAILRDRHGVDAEYTILGVGACRDELSALARSLGIEDRVVFPGFVDSVAERIAASDIVIVPSLWQEPFGLTVIESMVCRKPVIANRVGGIPEVIEDGVNGFLVSPENAAEEIVRKVLLLQADPALAEEISNRARETVLERFTIETSALRTRLFYDRLLAGRSRGGSGRTRQAGDLPSFR